MAVTRFLAKNTPTQVNTNLLGVQIQLEPTPEPPVEAIEAFVFNTSGVKFNKKETSSIQGKTEWSETWGVGGGPVVPGGATVWTDADEPAVGDVVYTNQVDPSQGQGEVEDVYPQKFPEPPVEPECLSIGLTYQYETIYGTGYVSGAEDYQLYHSVVRHTYVDDGEPVEMEYEVILMSTNDDDPVEIDGTYYYMFAVYDGDPDLQERQFFCASEFPQVGDNFYLVGNDDETGDNILVPGWEGEILYELSDEFYNTYCEVEGQMFYAEGLPPYGDNQARPAYVYKAEDYWGTNHTWIVKCEWYDMSGGGGFWQAVGFVALYDYTDPYDTALTLTKTNNTSHYPGKVEWMASVDVGDENYENYYVWTDNDHPEVNDMAYYNPAEPDMQMSIEEVEYTEPDEPDPVDPYEPPAPDEPNCTVSYSVTGEADTWTDCEDKLTDLNNVIANIPRYIYLKFSQDVIITEE